MIKFCTKAFLNPNLKEGVGLTENQTPFEHSKFVYTLEGEGFHARCP